MKTIVITKINSQYVHVVIDGKKIVMKQGDVFSDEKHVKICKFCGRMYDQEEYFKTMCEQTEGRRDPDYFNFNTTSYCGLYCAWMKQPDFCRRVIKEEELEKMKDDVASRVSKFLREVK